MEARLLHRFAAGLPRHNSTRDNHGLLGFNCPEDGRQMRGTSGIISGLLACIKQDRTHRKHADWLTPAASPMEERTN